MFGWTGYGYDNNFHKTGQNSPLITKNIRKTILIFRSLKGFFVVQVQYFITLIFARIIVIAMICTPLGSLNVLGKGTLFPVILTQHFLVLTRQWEELN